MSENGNAAHALREAARKKIYRELKFSDFDPSFEGKVQVRVNLTHAEYTHMQEIAEALRGEREHLELLPANEENQAERAGIAGRLRELSDRYLVFMGDLLGMDEAETLAFFRNEQPDQDPIFERWVIDAASELVREHRDRNFTKPKTG